MDLKLYKLLGHVHVCVLGHILWMSDTESKLHRTPALALSHHLTGFLEPIEPTLKYYLKYEFLSIYSIKLYILILPLLFAPVTSRKPDLAALRLYCK